MNKNQKIIGLVILVVVISGFCIYLIDKTKKQKKQIDKLSKKQKATLSQNLKNKVQANPDGNLDEAIEQFLKENQEVFLGQNIQVIKQELKKELEESVKEIIQQELPLDLEKLNELLESKHNTLIEKEIVEAKAISIPEPISDQVTPQEETKASDLASEEEMNEKIISRLGEKAFHDDLMKLATVKVSGRPPLSEEGAKELIRNISGYNNLAPTSKIFTPDVDNQEVMPAFVCQLCRKHKLSKDHSDKFAMILSKNISQHLGQKPATIRSYWARPMRNRTPEQLKNDPHFLYLEP